MTITRTTLPLFSPAILFALVLALTACTHPTATPIASAPATITLAPATVTPSTSPTAFRASTATPTPTPTRAFQRPSVPPRTPTARAAPTRTPPRQNIPTKVELRKTGNNFVLLVNGRPTYVKGLNYNVNYTALDEDLRRQLHRRDFRIMLDAGVNVVVGWGIYDDITLQVAQEFGIGIIMPFDLSPQAAYENQNVREEIKNTFRDYVLHYKDFPAVWAWNPGGDELLYRMRTEENRTPDKIQAAADFELELANLAYSLDPNHIVLIKEPRDWYLKYLYAAVQKAKVQANYVEPAKYILYGVNVYGKLDDVETVLTNTRQSIDAGLGMAMIVSEFAPLFLPRDERPQNYAAIWDIAFRISGIGGCAYVFGPDQPNPKAPNPYDPLVLLPSEYSMFDIDAKPVDGSLAALAVKWRALPAPTPYRSPTPTARPK